MITFVISIISKMKERILEFLRSENKSSAQLAEEIGVQPSGISHIISGRNNPSLDFVLKMLDRYSYLSSEWLLFGRGAMYRDNQMQTLFDNETSTEKSINKGDLDSAFMKKNTDIQGFKSDKDSIVTDRVRKSEGPGVDKIVWFYSNNTFEEYYPRG
jgi:transcriptional regulator with XRE-family HTH domain